LIRGERIMVKKRVEILSSMAVNYFPRIYGSFKRQRKNADELNHRHFKFWVGK